MGIWVVGTSNQLFIRGSKTETNLKNEVLTGKTPFSVIGPFCTYRFVCLKDWLLILQFCMEMMRFQF